MSNRIKFVLFTSVFSLLSLPAFADWQLQPHGSVGFNSVQGTYVSLGLDETTQLADGVTAGVGGYYASGDDPANDREIGGGPFIGFIYPVSDFLFAGVREDVDYVDAHLPYIRANGTRSYTDEHGVLSATNMGVQMFLTRFLGVSGGYRWVNAVDNSQLDDGRSGFYFGAALMF
jgi:hypothetical protein